MKKLLTILCAHRPAQDPRVIWVTNSCKGIFDTTLVGITDSLISPIDGVQTKHGQLAEQGSFEFAWLLIKALYKNANAKEKIILSVMVGAMTVALPLVGLMLLTMNKLLSMRKARSGPQQSANEPSHPNKPSRLSRLSQLSLFREPMIFLYCCQLLFKTNSALYHLLHMSEKPDVIYANDLESGIAAVLYKQQHHGVRVVYDCHEFWPHAYATRNRLHPTFFRFIEKIILRKADQVVTVNELLAEQISSAYDCHVEHLYNAAPYDGDAPAGLVEQTDGPVRFIFQGIYSRDRGLEELVTTWDKGQFEGKAELILRGPENCAYAQCFLSLCRSLPCYEKSLFIQEPVTEENLVTALDGMHVGIIPYPPVDLNFKYSCPNKLSQYMQAGLAILANKTEFVKSIVQNEQVGLIYDSERSETLIDCISQMIENRPFLESMRVRARLLVREKYNWQSQEPKLVEIIKAA